MMLLIGMWISFTKKPINPITANPMAVARAIRWNSAVTTHVIRPSCLQLQSLTFQVWFSASFHQSHRVLGEVFDGLDVQLYLVHDDDTLFLGGHF